MSAVQELQRLLQLPSPPLNASSSQNNNNNNNNNNPVLVAHAALQHLRECGDPQWLFLRSLVEILVSQEEQQTPPPPQQQIMDHHELVFHCIAGSRQVLVWRYDTLSRAFVTRVRHWLFCIYLGLFGQQQQQQCSITHPTTRAAAASAVACWWKRGWNDTRAMAQMSAAEQAIVAPMSAANNNNNRTTTPLTTLSDLFAYLETNFSHHVSAMGQFLETLLTEFGASSISYRLPLEFHKASHLYFESEGPLWHSLRLAVSALQHVSQSTMAAPNNDNGICIPDPSSVNAVIKLCTACLTWHFGTSGWDDHSLTSLPSSKAHIALPTHWREVLAPAHQTLCQPLLVLHQHLRVHHPSVAHNLRELLMSLASLSGPVLLDENGEKQQYSAVLCVGSGQLLQQAVSPVVPQSLEVLDALQVISRLVANFRLSTLLPNESFVPLLRGLTNTGVQLLRTHVDECQQNGGDVQAMEHYDWREEVLSLLLECAVLLCEDPWLLYSGTEHSRQHAKTSLSNILGPLFEGFVQCRMQMAAMEEHYLVTNDADLDEVREEITEHGMEEEMESLAAIGRLNLAAAIACLSTFCGTILPRLQALWDSNGSMTPEAAALLEESRLLIMYVSHLLTDNNQGESQVIPEGVLHACRELPGLSHDVAAAVGALLQFAVSQTQKIATNPSNPLLSPLMAKTFLWFLDRWVPAYVYPVDLGALDANNSLVLQWSSPESANHIVSLCMSLCLSYQTHWPQEPQVQENAGNLLLHLSKRGGKLRPLIVAAPAFQSMVRFHCLTAGLRHSASKTEFQSVVRAKHGATDVNLPTVWGYHRLPYQDKSRFLTAILVACGDASDETANAMIQETLKAVHDAFSSLVDGLVSKTVAPDDVHAKEMACLCIEMFCGIVNASEMLQPERIPQFVAPYLPELSGLMTYYAKDLTICESLLRFFRDYTARFLSLLDREQSLVLFQSCAQLLESYSVNHCVSRVIVKHSKAEEDTEEEQAYNDILCVIQLLINLGTKEFIDVYNDQDSVDTSQVTDMIFFGLQQILPVMSQGLLQFPTLCYQFFELVGFTMDAYPEKVCVLPLHLFESLTESLLFGISHHNVDVAKSCFRGLASIAREQLQKGTLRPHLAQKPDLLDNCTRRVLVEVVFQTVVLDRIEATGLALLPLVAVDLNRSSAVVQQVSSQTEEAQRLQQAFSKLFNQEILSQASQTGAEGRTLRIRFKQGFEDFVREVHSFLVFR